MLPTDRDAITLFYYNHGFPDVQFEAVATPVAGEPLRMNVVYTITEGATVFVDRVVVTGLEFTRPFTWSTANAYHDGDPLSQAAWWTRSGGCMTWDLFNEVNMAVQNPDGQVPSKDVLFDLHEAKRWTFRYGGGIEFATGNIPTTSNPQGSTGVSPNGVLEITRLNMFGTRPDPHHASAGWACSPAADSSAMTRHDCFTARTGASPSPPSTTTPPTSTPSPPSGWKARPGGTEVQPHHHPALPHELSARSRSIPTAWSSIPTLIPLYSQPVLVAMPSFTYLRDTRDNPIESHKGSYTIGDLGLATSALGSESNFGKVLLHNSTYYTLKKKWVLARNTQIGIEHPYGTNDFLGTPPTGPCRRRPHQFPCRSCSSPAAAIRCAASPSTRRGRATSKRAIPSVDRDCSSTTWSCVHLRVQLPFVGDNLSFVFFHDMGNVFATAHQILSGILRIHQPSIAACSPRRAAMTLCNFSYNPQAIGAGRSLQDTCGPGTFRSRLQPQPDAVSHPGTGQGGVAATYQLLFQHWADILMRRILHFAMCMLLLPATILPRSRGRGHRRRGRHREPEPVFRSDWDEAVRFEAIHAAEAADPGYGSRPRRSPAAAD